MWRFALALLPLPVAAEVDVIDRLNDCLGPRADAQKYEAWLIAPCQKDDSCEPFDASRPYDPSYISCSIEAFAICRTPGEGVGEKCVGNVVEFLEAEISRIETEIDDDRISALQAKGTRVSSKLLENSRETLREREAFDCPLPMDWPLRADHSDDPCLHYEQVFRFARLRGIEDTILRKEAGQ